MTLFVPGSPRFATGWQRAVTGLPSPPEVEWIDNDGHFGKAFSFGTVAPDRVAEIEEAPGALVLHWPVGLLTGRAAIVAAIARLREAGALAVRLEQSKVGWDIERWIERFSSNDPWAWYRGAVAWLGDEGEAQSCGMHAFSMPDVRVPTDGDRDALVEFASVLSVYQPLTQAQVEAARDQGACIAMEPRDTQTLERTRGYADIDPELAWEQWQLVRKMSR